MKNVKWLRFFGAALFWLIIWYLVAKKQGTELLLPYPMSVLRRLSELVVTAEFWRIAMTSLFRIFTAFLTGAAIGSAAAAACAVSKIFKALVSPAMTVIRATPIASFIILLLLWLPSAGSVSLWAAVLMTAPIFWANLSRAIETVDPRLLEMAKVYHFGRGKTFRHIYLPSLQSAVLSACENGVGLAWKAGVAAEVLTRPKLAIGRMVYETRMYLETVDLFAWTTAVVLLSLAVEKGVRVLVRRRRRHD